MLALTLSATPLDPAPVIRICIYNGPWAYILPEFLTRCQEFKRIFGKILAVVLGEDESGEFIVDEFAKPKHAYL